MECCKNCKHYIPEEEVWKKIKIEFGICNRFSGDVYIMKEDDVGLYCGHDGPILVGSKFCCKHFELVDEETMNNEKD